MVVDGADAAEIDREGHRESRVAHSGRDSRVPHAVGVTERGHRATDRVLEDALRARDLTLELIRR
jgi:hypothetical protein